jgi:2-polyprenyl-3-methyl-5-hydroxy-6-metoxy-1,4-benzoquinol methylase/ribosomal protein S27AE
MMFGRVTRPPARFRCPACSGEVVLQDVTSRISCGACATTFATDEGIVALTPPPSDADYPHDLVDLVAAVEERHFWFTARNDVIVSTLQHTLAPARGTRALDVGCSTGFVMAALEKAGLDVAGIDMHRSALLRARTRVGGPLFASTATTLPFFPDFDIVTLFDVIEHVDDEVGMLAQARGALVPHGHVVVTVPAGPNLWTTYDEVIGHKRRYTRATLVAALEQAQFAVRYVSYFNAALFLAGVVRRSGPGRSETIDRVETVRRALRVPPGPLNTLFRWSVGAEAPLRQFSWLRGGSLIAVAERL